MQDKGQNSHADSSASSAEDQELLRQFEQLKKFKEDYERKLQESQKNLEQQSKKLEKERENLNNQKKAFEAEKAEYRQILSIHRSVCYILYFLLLFCKYLYIFMCIRCYYHQYYYIYKNII